MSGNVLFLCSCSNRKLAGGESAYRPADSMPLAVPRRAADLIEARRNALSRIQDGAASVRGTLLRDLPYNAAPPLMPGPDLGGTVHGRYMPAMARYRGRFFMELDPDECGALGESPHRWIIVSALYGLLTPDEPIQRYTCHTEDDAGIAGIWKKDGLLTSLLLEYIQVFDVGLIVDLMAEDSYHCLFKWEKIEKRVEVLRAFGDQNAGPALLPALGFLARKRLLQAPAEEMFGIKGDRTYHTDYEDVLLTRSYREPPPPFLTESSSPAPEPPNDGDVGPPEPPEPPSDPGGECVVLPGPRAIGVTSDDHRTIFGYRITRIEDLPSDVRALFDRVSCAAEVLDIRLGAFRSKGRRKEFKIDVARPSHERHGVIECKLRGPGRIGGTQHLRIRVTPGREWATYRAVKQLLDV